MKKILKYMTYTAMMAMALQFLSCTRESVPAESGEAVVNEDGTITFTVGAVFPGMRKAATRLGENPPTLSDGVSYGLDIYLFVFDEFGLRETKVVPAPQTRLVGQSEDEHKMGFNVTLHTTGGETFVHLIATNDPNFKDRLNEQGLEQLCMYGLYTENPYEAYWQRITLPDGIGVDSGDPKKADADVQAAFRDVPLIRNFSCVSVEVQPSQPDKQLSTDNFELHGFQVINTLDRGSVVPMWLSADGEMQYALFDSESLEAHYQDDPYFAGKDSREDNIYYSMVSRQGYKGRRAVESELKNKAAELPGGSAGWNDSPKYFYERPFEETNNPSCVILCGTYTGGGGSGKPTFYKVDLGSYRDGRGGVFSYFNLLRNIEYNIQIYHVESDGYPTPAEAASGVAYNNFSGGIETRKMVGCSDGNDMIQVNFTSYVVVSEEPIDFRYQYLINIKQNGGTLANELVSYDWPDIGMAPGEVIRDFSPATDVSGNSWKQVLIYPQTPTEEIKQQTFTIFREEKGASNSEYGMSRVITLISRVPWDYLNMDTYPGHYDSFEALPEDWGTDVTREIGSEEHAPLTLFFELPEALPEAMFPLEFVIESSKQNIQNAYVGNAVVRYGSTLFPVEAGATPPTRIQYVKTVSWEDYQQDRIVRCRFLTITDLRHEAIGAQEDGTYSLSELIVYNPYFNTKSDTFFRDLDTPDPVNPIICDFDSNDWKHPDLIISGYGLGRTEEYSEEGDLIGHYYDASPQITFRIAKKYPGTEAYTAELFLEAASAFEEAKDDPQFYAEVTVTATGVEGTPTVEESPMVFSSERERKSVKINIPAGTSEVTTVVISFSISTKVYKLEYYPQGTANP